MADLAFQAGLAANGQFQERVRAALINAAIAIAAEAPNEVQTVSITGSPTGGSFILNGLPSDTKVITGTITTGATTCTGMASTNGLTVGMSISGTGIAAGTTVSAIVSSTAITLSANATGTGSNALTFVGNTGTVAVPFNATAGVLAGLLKNTAIGGSAVCSGGPLPGTAITVTFNGSFSSQPLNLMTVGTNSLTGGSSPTPVIARTTAGVAFPAHSYRMAQVARVLTGSYDLFRYALATAGNATVAADFNANYTPSANEATLANDIQFVVNGNWNAFN